MTIIDPPSQRRARKHAADKVWNQLELSGIVVAFFAVLAFILVAPSIRGASRYDIKAGEIATEDIIAPREIRFVSTLETSAAREAAVAGIEEVFDPPNPQVGRQQVRLASQIMAFAAIVREDSYADETLKKQYLDAIEMLSLDEAIKKELLTITSEEFNLVAAEVTNLVEVTMSGTVREGQVEKTIELIELKVNPELPERLIPISVAIASDLVAPNSRLNASATEQARQTATNAIPEISRTIQEGEVISRAGEPVTDLDLEAMRALGLTDSQFHLTDLVIALLAALVITASLTGQMVAGSQPRLDTVRKALPVLVLFLVFAGSAQIFATNEPGLFYLFPAAALTITLTALYGFTFGALVALLLAVVLGLMMDQSLEIAVYTLMACLAGNTSLRRGGRLTSYFVAGLSAAAAGAIARLIFRLEPGIPLTEVLALTTFPLLNGMLSAGLALVLLLLIGTITGILTPLKLLDLTRADHPLQRQLQQEALGTYQHTLTVANLVEAAAEAIGADTLLSRVGTLYHDIGKLSNPGFYVENRLDGGGDPHAGLRAQASARIIMGHVEEGVRMARRNRLPEQLIAFITEHHGTMPALYFLNKAREEAEADGTEVDEHLYYYKGPRPQSRETAILMLCDGAASAVRAAATTEPEEIEKIITHIIQQRMDYSQLDDSGLTLNDIKLIRESLARTLRGMYHPRIKYPDPKPLPAGGMLKLTTESEEDSDDDMEADEER